MPFPTARAKCSSSGRKSRYERRFFLNVFNFFLFTVLAPNLTLGMSIVFQKKAADRRSRLEQAVGQQLFFKEAKNLVRLSLLLLSYFIKYRVTVSN